MNVKEVMSREVRSIRMGDRLDAAARVMWDNDCGIVPVVDGNGAVVGVLTDRDLCMAAWTQGRPLAEIPATAAMGRSVRTCKPDDAVSQALAAMQQHQVHRLPVVDARGVVVGIVTVNDLVRLAASRPAAIDGAGITKALAAIVAPRKAATARTNPPLEKQAPDKQAIEKQTPEKPAPEKPAPEKTGASKAAPAPTPTLGKAANAPRAAAAAPISVALPAIVKPTKAKDDKHGKGRKS